MKYLLFLTLMSLIIMSCGKILPQKSISYGLPRIGTPRDSFTAFIKHYGRKKFDSLFIQSKKMTLAVSIPHSNTIHFVISATSKYGVFLQTKDRTKELVFCTKDSSWSKLKNRDFKNYGPH